MSASQKAEPGAWIAVAAGLIGALMATLDISIVNAALPTIQGEIGASGTEGTWVSTAYLVAEIVAIALAGWFEKLLGLRRFLLICTIGFVLSSTVCGLSSSLNQMIFGRVGQGIFGGALIPTALSVVATRLPPGEQPKGTALFAMTAVLGPVLGPVIGGWLTENVSWHYAFFINLPIGAMLIAMLLIGLPADKGDRSLLKDADVFGIVGLAMGLGALTVVLEEGQRERWFESPFIVELAVVSAVGFVLLFVGQAWSSRPVIALKLLKTKAFAAVFVMSLAIGAGLYGTLYLIPQFLDRFAEYNAQQAGYAAAVSGVPTLMLVPLFPRLVKLIDVRVAIAFGLAIYGYGCVIDKAATLEWNGFDFVPAQIMRGVGQFFVFLFLNQAATSSAPTSLASDASGLYNAGRNLGGSFSLAIINTMEDRRGWFWERRIAEGRPANSELAQEYRAQLAEESGMSAGADAMLAADAQLSETIMQQADVLAFGEMFWVIGVIMLCSIPFVMFLRPLPKNPEPAAG